MVPAADRDSGFLLAHALTEPRGPRTAGCYNVPEAAMREARAVRDATNG